MSNFAKLSPEERKEMARRGGEASQRSGKAHRWNSESARAASKKASRGKRR